MAGTEGPLRIAVVVSSDPSDLYFANQIAQELPVVAILVENQRPIEADTKPWQRAARVLRSPLSIPGKVVARLAERYRARGALYLQAGYQSDFGVDGTRLAVPDGCLVRWTSGRSDVNAPENVAWLKDQRPDVVAVCGTSMLSPGMFSIPPRGTLNLHGGLSQYYRGLNPTDWAVQNGDLECVGATVHFVTAGIDDGQVIFQGRPDISAADHPNSLYAKVVRLGVRMMCQALRDMERGESRSVPLSGRGRLYLGRQYTDAARARTWKKYSEGVVARYVESRAERDRRIELLNPFQ